MNYFSHFEAARSGGGDGVICQQAVGRDALLWESVRARFQLSDTLICHLCFSMHSKSREKSLLKLSRGPAGPVF